MEKTQNAGVYPHLQNYYDMGPLSHSYPFMGRVPWESHPPAYNPYATPFFIKLSHDLTTLTSTLAKNNKKIISSLQNCERISASLDEAEGEVNDKLSQLKKGSKELFKPIIFSQLNEVPFFTNQALIANIFHRESFKYKLKLEQKFPRILFKDRKLTLKVKLTNPDGSQISNANFLHLSIGACDEDGQWILNDNGNLFMGGKVEVDLYHGEAEFKRVFPTDISRRYSTNTLKVIIYAKGSLLKFTGSKDKYQKQVNPVDIEPLVISGIIVKAKKKS